MTSGPDGALWFTETAGNKVGRITTAGAIAEYPIPTPIPNGNPEEGPWGITAGPDGALWFTEYAANKIGRITTTGVITEYPIPTPLSGPSDITSGPDGALWFSEYDGGVGNNIGRITTEGAITEYPLPNASSGPNGITEGLDGAIWFVEFSANKIGRITGGGEITEYALPPKVANCSDIAAGPDGALWFNCGYSIGRITTEGAISTFTLSGPSGAMTTGPDGGLWFGTANCLSGPSSCTPVLGRLSPSTGAVSEYSLPPRPPYAGAGGITFGPDGALWFVHATEIDRAALTFPTPNIQAVRNGADDHVQTVQSGSWVSIYGYNLAPDSRIWGAQDIVDDQLPLALDGVSVTIDGKPAAVEYISPSQMNVLAPADTATGPVNVIVSSERAVSAPFTAQLQTYSPAFFTYSPPNQRYIAAVFAPESDGTAVYVAPTGAFGADAVSRPATDGDILELYGTGFGPTNPAPPANQEFAGAYPTVTTVTVSIGGINANVLWAGVSSPGTYQLNVIMPAGVPAGDAVVIATVGGVQTQDTFSIPTQQ